MARSTPLCDFFLACSAEKKARGALQLLSPCPLVSLAQSAAAPSGLRGQDSIRSQPLSGLWLQSRLQKPGERESSQPGGKSCLFKSPGPQARLCMTVSRSQASLRGVGLITSQRRKPRLPGAKKLTVGESSLLIRKCGLESPHYVEGIEA